MSRRLITTAIATALLVAGLAACGPNDSITSTPDKAAASGSKSNAATKQTAKIGDTLTLTGQKDGEKIAVTLTKWTTSVHSSNEFETPQSGKQWVAAQFQLQNVGTSAYSDSPTNGTQAADSSGQHYQPTMVTSIDAGAIMTSDLKLAPGDKGLGWIVYEVPTGTNISTVQFALDSGFGGQTGQWTIK